ncbi:hypothetical protein D3C83_95360 [compost metagenome]
MTQLFGLLLALAIQLGVVDRDGSLPGQRFQKLDFLVSEAMLFTGRIDEATEGLPIGH